MKILSIETSCDETAVSIVEANGGLESPIFTVLGNALFSQIDIHKKYGGVFPMLAKREHAKNLPELLKKVLIEANILVFSKIPEYYSEEKWKEVEEIVKREESLYAGLRDILKNVKKPNIDVISVTSGPGLVPALWVGISCAQALGKLWNIPVVGINHMEGHIASVLMNKTEEFPISNFQFSEKSTAIKFPALALLISGGHTELVEIECWGKYSVIGQTRDDAVGEAFDKVARMLGLPYPGGPEISRLAEYARTKNIPRKTKFTRPMIHSRNLDFSFSGLKTAVLYYIRDNIPISEELKADIAREFEDTIIDVLLNKTEKVLEEIEVKTLIVAGGVIANKKIRETFSRLKEKFTGLVVKIPTKELSTDNAIMIACATYINLILYPELLSSPKKIIADGNLRLKQRPVNNNFEIKNQIM